MVNILCVQQGDPTPTKISDVPLRVIQMCGTLRNLVEDTVGEEDIPVPNVSPDIMKIIIGYYVGEHHVTKSAQQQFMQRFSKDEKIRLINAADYLDCPIIHVVGYAIAEEGIKGKTVQQIRDYLNIENDLTPEEEVAIKEENAWAFPHQAT